MSSSPFTKLLNQYVQRRNLPVERLAAMANIPRKTLYRWINGEIKRPRYWSQVVDLARALKLSETESDALLQAARMPSLRELVTLADNNYEREQLQDFLDDLSRAAQPRPIPAPLPSYDTWAFLEAPAGAVRPDSPFYIERLADEQLTRQVLGNGTTTTIQAGRQTGKTSLLMQGLHRVRAQDHPCVYLDFQVIEEEDRQDLESLLRYISSAIAEQLDLDPEGVTKLWSGSGGPVRIFNRYLQRQVLPQLEAPLLLAIDEADQLLGVDYKQNFFALLRAWDSRRAYDEVWRKLNLVLVISTHPYLLIDDVNLSPFNVGLTISLQDFTPEQVTELNRRHSTPLTPAEIPTLMELVGGHPYLVRQALYSLVCEDCSLSELQKSAIASDGLFGKHLRFYRHSLSQSPDLQQALTRIVRDQDSQGIEEILLDRLAAVGLVRKSPQGWEPRCGLYQLYFQEQLA
jgi:hypothetical protein